MTKEGFRDYLVDLLSEAGDLTAPELAELIIETLESNVVEISTAENA